MYKKLIKDAKRFCNGGTFYTPVTAEEKQQVYQAMAAQFTGTGHWYYCQNRHPVGTSIQSHAKKQAKF
jgi:hypothetical protein